MIDIHTHILPQIDDGARSVNESINLIKEAKLAGFDDIILTSHFCESLYEKEEEDRAQIIELMKKVLEKLKIDVNLYIGNEIYITEDIVELIENKKASTLNHSRYVLFELPLRIEKQNARTIIYQLIEKNYIPIMAHPERYQFIQEDPDRIDEFIDMGVLLQSNYGSILGLYGDSAKKTIIKFLKKDIISFFGSDVHRQNTIYSKMDTILKKITKIIGEDRLEEITTINPMKILANRK